MLSTIHKYVNILIFTCVRLLDINRSSKDNIKVYHSSIW